MRGSIRQRSGDSWSLQIELDRAAGKRRRRFITVKGSYKDAQRALTKLLTAADAGSCRIRQSRQSASTSPRHSLPRTSSAPRR